MQSLNDISTWNGMDMLGYIQLFLNVQQTAANNRFFYQKIAVFANFIDFH